MNKMFRGIEFIQAYIDELLIINNGDWFDDLEKLELTLQNFKDNGLKRNIKKFFFGITEM